MYMTKMMMEQEIISLLGGRAAEELVIKDITTGASNDIERATSMARDMVTKYGMSELLGPIQFGGDNDEVFIGRDWGHARNIPGTMFLNSIILSSPLCFPLFLWAAPPHLQCPEPRCGNDKVPVFASPRLISWIEGTAIGTVAPFLPEGWETVGTTFDLAHLAATPVGMKVRVVTEVTEVKGKLLTYSVKAYDEVDKICEGTHGRAIIELDKFLSRVNKKGTK